MSLILLFVSVGASADRNSEIMEIMGSAGYLEAMQNLNSIVNSRESEKISSYLHQIINEPDTGKQVAAILTIVSFEPESYPLLYRFLTDKNHAVQFIASYTLRDVAKAKGAKLETVHSILNALKDAWSQETDIDSKQSLGFQIREITEFYQIDDMLLEKDTSKQLGEGEGFEIFITSAKWCAPCRVLHENLKKENNFNLISVQVEKTSYRLPILFIDIDKHQESLRSMNIESDGIPQFFLLNNGQKVFRSELAGAFNSKTVENAAIQAIQSYRAQVRAETVSPKMLFDSLTSRPVTKSRITLIGTGADANENPLFVSFTLKNIKVKLQQKYFLSDSQFVTLYGAGPKSHQRDTKEIADGNVVFKHIENLKTDASFTSKTLQSVYSANTQQHIKNSLFVYAGYGSPDGIAGWEERKKILPLYLQQLQTNSESTNIIVSGNCYGGQFSLSTDCGFFGARPDTTASGCWESRPDTLKDYASVFFSAAHKDGRLLTFEESHWYSVIYGDPQDTPYTSLDGLSDEAFQQYPNQLPDLMTVQEARTLAEKVGTSGERSAFTALTNNLNLDLSLPLKRATVFVPFKSNIKARLELDPFRSQISTDAIFSFQHRALVEKIMRNDAQRAKPIPTNAVFMGVSLYTRHGAPLWMASFQEVGKKILLAPGYQ